jgi:hypothetical protein
MSINLGQYETVPLHQIDGVFVVQGKKVNFDRGNISFLDSGLIVPYVIH